MKNFLKIMKKTIIYFYIIVCLICKLWLTTEVGFISKAEPDDIKFVQSDMVFNDIINGDTSLIYLLPQAQNQQSNKNTLIQNLHNTLETILSADNFNSQGLALLLVGTVPNSTWAIEFTSREAPIPQNLHFRDNPIIIPVQNLNIIANAYSNQGIDSTQGEFEISNALRLFHTEPKALDSILTNISMPGRLLQSAVLISKKDICPCCARLIVGLLQSKRVNLQSFPPNFFTISDSTFSIFKDSNLKKLNNILEDIFERNKLSVNKRDITRFIDNDFKKNSYTGSAHNLFEHIFGEEIHALTEKYIYTEEEEVTVNKIIRMHHKLIEINRILNAGDGNKLYLLMYRQN